jgi:hypothetical protein
VKGSGSDSLVIVDKGSGRATIVGPIEFKDVFGLVWHPSGKLIGASHESDTRSLLITIDPTTGAGRPIGVVTGANGIGGLSLGRPRPGWASVRNMMLARTVDQNRCVVPSQTRLFAPSDQQAWVWFDVVDASAGDQARANWHNPSGDVYSSFSWNPVASDGSWCFFAPLAIAGNQPASLRGVWKVSVFWNNFKVFELPLTIQ